MKKILSLLLACTLLFTLCACGGEKIDETDANAIQEPTTEVTTEPTTEAKQLLTAELAAYLYNDAYTVACEWFCFFSSYWNFDDAVEGTEPYSYYYAIEHDTLKSTADLKAYLCEYFSESLVDGLIKKAYMDKDGKLYKLCYEAGDRMPVYDFNKTTAALISEEEDKAVYDVAIIGGFEGGEADDLPTEFTENLEVEYVYENGRWVINNTFTFNLYPEYTWDEKSPLTE